MYVLDFQSQDRYYGRFDTRRSPPPEVEIKSITSRSFTRGRSPRNGRSHEGMHGLSVHEESYAVLYTRRAHRFPNVAQILPKPVFTQHMATPTPAASFSLQAPVLPFHPSVNHGQLQPTLLPSRISLPTPLPFNSPRV